MRCVAWESRGLVWLVRGWVWAAFEAWPGCGLAGIWGGAPGGKRRRYGLLKKPGNCRGRTVFAVVAKDKVGRVRPRGYRGDCFPLFLFSRRETVLLQRQDSRRRGFGERKVLAAGCRCQGRAPRAVGLDVCRLGQKQLGVCVCASLGTAAHEM